MRKLPCLLALSVLAAPLAARADLSMAINFRGGVAMPWGDLAKSAPMSDGLDWGFPLQGDLAFRFTKEIGVGAYVRYAPLTMSDKAQNSCRAVGGLPPQRASISTWERIGIVSCSGSDLGFGGLVEYRFGERLDGGGWVGANVGYEMLAVKGGTGAEKTTLKGFEGSLQAGYDFTLAALTIGPFVNAGIGQFSKAKSEVGGQTTTASITEKAMHGWLGVGIRVGILL